MNDESGLFLTSGSYLRPSLIYSCFADICAAVDSRKETFVRLDEIAFSLPYLLSADRNSLSSPSRDERISVVSYSEWCDEHI